MTGESLADAAGSRRPRRKRGLGSYLMLLPAAGFIGLVLLYPLVRVVDVSLHSGARGDEGPATFDNYRFVLEDPVFRQALRHNLTLLLAVPVVTVLAIAIALILNEGVRFWRTYRTLIFLPYVLSIPVLGSAFLLLYGLHGPLNRILEGVGLGVLSQEWFGDPGLVLPSIASIVVYHELGFGVVLLLARLLTLPPEPFDAARLDGASWWKIQRFVTLPQLRSTIVTFVVLELITMLSAVFAYVYSTTRGGPNFAASVLELYIFDNAFTFQSPSLAAAVAVLLLVPTSIVVFLWVRRTPTAEMNLE